MKAKLVNEGIFSRNKSERTTSFSKDSELNDLVKQYNDYKLQLPQMLKVMNSFTVDNLTHGPWVQSLRSMVTHLSNLEIEVKRLQNAISKNTTQMY